MTKFREKIEKLMWMALDQGGNENQMNAAAAAIFRLCRDKGMRPDAFQQLIGGNSQQQHRQPPPKSPLEQDIGFGKYRGNSIAWVAKYHSSYLRWCLKNFTDMYDETRSLIMRAMAEEGQPE